jgi:hypothetical protein
VLTIIYNPTHGQPILGQSDKPCLLAYCYPLEDGTYGSQLIRPGIQTTEYAPPEAIAENPDILILEKVANGSADLNTQEASFAIQGHHDIDLLREFCDGDKRATVAKAMDLRIRQLQQEIDAVKARENNV